MIAANIRNKYVYQKNLKSHWQWNVRCAINKNEIGENWWIYILYMFRFCIHFCIYIIRIWSIELPLQGIYLFWILCGRGGKKQRMIYFIWNPIKCTCVLFITNLALVDGTRLKEPSIVFFYTIELQFVCVNITHMSNILSYLCG